MFYRMASLLYQKSGSSSTPLREVGEYEIEFQLRDGGCSMIDGNAYPIRSGQMLLAKPGMERYTTGDYSCLAIHFSCSDDSFSEHTLNRLPLFLPPPVPGEMEKLMRAAYQTERERTPGKKLRMEGILFQLLAEYMDVSEITQGSYGEYSRYTAGVHRTVEYMRKNYADQITMSQLAGQLFLSVNFYHKIFRAIMGIPPARYLRNIRLEEACRLLTNTDLTMEEIAERCGFNCASYLAYTVKKQLGITPLEYRRRNRMLI